MDDRKTPLPRARSTQTLAPPAATKPTDRAMAKLRALYQRAGLVWVLQAGKLIVDELYGGDVGRFYDQDGQKDDPFEEMVADHRQELADMKLGSQSLRNYVKVWDVHRHLPPDLQDKLTASHLLELHPLAADRDRIDLARLCVLHAWTVEELDAAVAERQQLLLGDEPRRGRPRLTEQVKTVNLADRTLARLEDLRSQHGSLADLPLGQSHAIRTSLQSILARTRALLDDFEG